VEIRFHRKVQADLDDVQWRPAPENGRQEARTKPIQTGVAERWNVWHRLAMSRKESILDAIQRLPDDVEFVAAIEEIRILQQIEAAEKAADEGRVRNHEEVRDLIRSWTSG